MNDTAAARTIEAPAPQSPVGALSPSTRRAIGLMAVVLVVLVGLDVMRSLGALGAGGAVVDLAIGILPLCVGLYMVPMVRRFGAGGTIRLQWGHFTAAMLTAGIGSVLAAVLTVITGHDPFPSIADVFYLALYPFMLGGLIMAVVSYRGIAKFAVPAIVAAAVSLAAGAAVYLLVLAPHVIGGPTGELPPVALALTVIDPLADCFLILGPAVLLGLLLTRLGSGAIARPWWAIVVGSLALAGGDAAYSYLKAIGSTATLGPNVCFTIAALGMGLAATLAHDLYAA